MPSIHISLHTLQMSKKKIELLKYYNARFTYRQSNALTFSVSIYKFMIELMQ